MRQDFEKTRRTQFTFYDDGFEKITCGYFRLNKRKSIFTFFPALCIVIVYTRVGKTYPRLE